MLKVLDFYTSGKLCTNKLHKSLMHDVLFCVLVEVNGVTKELAITATKKYRYKTYKSGAYFIPKKAHEYNILYDFLVSAKSRVISKWNLTEVEFDELLSGLEFCLIEKYGDCSKIRKLILLCEGTMKKFIKDVSRRFGKC